MQVHKVVLNQRISTSLNIQPLSTNKSSWCWFGMNLPEEQSEPVVEKLAIRFKTEAISNKFFDAIQECLFQLSTSECKNFFDEFHLFLWNEFYDEFICSDNQEASEQNEPAESDDRKTGSDVDDERDYGEDDYAAYDYDEEYPDGDDEYEPDGYVDEQGISEAMEEIEGEILIEKEAHVEVLEGDNVIAYEGVINLLKKYDEEKQDSVGCMVFSTPSVTALYKTDITEKMNMIVSVSVNMASIITINILCNVFHLLFL